jgi:LacI family transcriptional regulator
MRALGPSRLKLERNRPVALLAWEDRGSEQPARKRRVVTTLSDVARAAGVSVSAVSRVLNDAPGTRVSDATRQRILETARQMDYRPNHSARSLRLQRTAVLACVLPDLTNALFSELVEGAEDAARERGYTLLLSRAEGMHDLDDTLARLLGEGRVDGAIVQMPDGLEPESLDSLVHDALPVVFLHAAHPRRTGSVMLDDAAATRTATDHLLALGHERVAFVGGLPGSPSARRREEGFREAMAQAGRTVDEKLVTRFGYRISDADAAMALLAEAQPRPTALVVANVNAGMAALGAARRMTWSVPEDLSVVAVHDAWPAEMTWPPLTTVRMPLRSLGRAAVDCLIERLQVGTAADRLLSDEAPQLILRASTSALKS